MNKPFQGVGVSTTDYSDGVIIMWDVKLEHFVKPLDLNLDWCVAIEITLGQNKCVIFNVHMLYQCNDNDPLYVEKLGILKATCGNGVESFIVACQSGVSIVNLIAF